jgi:hypothetical protein
MSRDQSARHETRHVKQAQSRHRSSVDAVVVNGPDTYEELRRAPRRVGHPPQP